MATALVKLSRDNLSNLHPHPFYAAFYYSHPPVVERYGISRQNPGASSPETGGVPRVPLTALLTHEF
jgi:hypothetical protein